MTHRKEPMEDEIMQIRETSENQSNPYDGNNMDEFLKKMEFENRAGLIFY